MISEFPKPKQWCSEKGKFKEYKREELREIRSHVGSRLSFSSRQLECSWKADCKLVLCWLVAGYAYNQD
jgi:hypothetical protein